MNKDDIEKAAENAVEFTKKQSWPEWVKLVIAAVIGAMAAIAGLLMTSCTPDHVRQAADVMEAVHTEHVDCWRK